MFYLYYKVSFIQSISEYKNLRCFEVVVVLHDRDYFFGCFLLAMIKNIKSILNSLPSGFALSFFSCHGVLMRLIVSEQKIVDIERYRAADQGLMNYIGAVAEPVGACLLQSGAVSGTRVPSPDNDPRGSFSTVLCIVQQFHANPHER